MQLTLERRLHLLDSPGAGEVLLLHEGARAAQPADAGVQHLLQSRARVGQTLQIHAVPQGLVEPGTQTQTDKVSLKCGNNLLENNSDIPLE